MPTPFKFHKAETLKEIFYFHEGDFSRRRGEEVYYVANWIPKYSSCRNLNIMHSFARAEPAMASLTPECFWQHEVSTETKIGYSGYQERHHFRPDLTGGERCCSAVSPQTSSLI